MDECSERVDVGTPGVIGPAERDLANGLYVGAWRHVGPSCCATLHHTVTRRERRRTREDRSG